jgi:hypothetical protein
MLPDLGIGQHRSLHGAAFFFLDDLVLQQDQAVLTPVIRLMLASL